MWYYYLFGIMAVLFLGLLMNRQPELIITEISVEDTDECHLKPIDRRANVCKPFATSNGTLDWLITHPAYYFKSYHGYFPWAPDDYSPVAPFDLGNPKVVVN